MQYWKTLVVILVILAESTKILVGLITTFALLAGIGRDFVNGKIVHVVGGKSAHNVEMVNRATDKGHGTATHM